MLPSIMVVGTDVIPYSFPFDIISHVLHIIDRLIAALTFTNLNIINDAPALAKADLGIAIGSGTDVAKETGRIILIKDRLKDVVTALDLGIKTVSKIKQNLFWAFVYNTGLISIAGGALVPFLGADVYSWLPFMAAGAMALSSVTVVGNSLLLGSHIPKYAAKKLGKEGEIYSEKELKQVYTPSILAAAAKASELA